MPAPRTACLLSALLLVVFGRAADAQESTSTAETHEPPYFVTYNDHLEEPRELEVTLLSTIGDPRDGSRYVAPWTELEYGVTRWWTAELYFEGATVRHDGSAFTGWRIENRFRPFSGDHVVNPILYVEYENISEASLIQKEIVGEGATPNEPIHELDEEHAHEIEGRLILSSHFGRWNVAENLILEKNVSESEGFEFGYAVAASRPIGQFIAGLEVYGGLGTTRPNPPAETRQFIAPLIGWRPTPASQLKFSFGFGTTNASERYLVRIGYSVEFE
jgi:hypothetical protein